MRPLEDRQRERVADAEDGDDDGHQQKRVDQVQDLVDLFALVEALNCAWSCSVPFG